MRFFRHSNNDDDENSEPMRIHFSFDSHEEYDDYYFTHNSYCEPEPEPVPDFKEPFSVGTLAYWLNNIGVTNCIILATPNAFSRTIHVADFKMTQTVSIGELYPRNIPNISCYDEFQ